MLTPGNVSDVKAAPALIERAGRMRYLLGDKGYDTDRLRRSLREAGAVPVIPGRRNRKRAIRYNHERYRDRHPHRIENAFCRTEELGLDRLRPPPRRTPLRQARRQVPVRRRPCHRRDLLALNESGPWIDII
jgi:hypothetical protein